MLACMNIRRNTQLQWTLLETEQSEIRFITTSIFPEVEKSVIISKLKHVSCVKCVDINYKVDIIYTVCVIESRMSLKRKPQKVVQTRSSLCETSFDESHRYVMSKLSVTGTGDRMIYRRCHRMN